VVRNPLLFGGPIITLVKWCYSAGKSVFGVAPAIVQYGLRLGQNASLTLNNYNKDRLETIEIKKAISDNTSSRY